MANFSLNTTVSSSGLSTLSTIAIVALARADDALGRMHDVLPARRHVGAVSWRAVVELHALADLEGVGLAVVGRLRHLGAEIADEVGRRRRIVGIDADQHAVERRRGMQRGVGRLACARRSSAARRPGSCRSACRRAWASRASAGVAASAADSAIDRPVASHPVRIVHRLPPCSTRLVSLGSRSIHLAAGHPMARAAVRAAPAAPPCSSRPPSGSADGTRSRTAD